MSVDNISPIVSLWGFFSCSRAATCNSAVHGSIRLNLRLSQYFIVVLVTCKNEEDLIKTEGARVFTTLYIDFSDAQEQLTPNLTWNLAEIRTHPRVHACPRYLQE